MIEPDEARYAEIPREMLATRDFVTPRLDAAHYFEKPPLLYWANAASIALLGPTPFAARLPTRLAALATVALLIGALGSAELPGLGLWSALIYLSAPLSWVLARYNITDGILTCALTLAFLALRRFLLLREEGKPATGALAVLGIGVGLATLAKGLIGIVFPGLVFLLWIAIMGRWRRLAELLVSPAPVLLLAVAAPWFVLVERANPGFAKIFFIREHFQRFATPEAARPGPIYYFVLAFIAGFLPWTVVFPRALAPLASAARGWRERARAHADTLFFALWFFVILVFFSLSHSKLLPYILPAFPAAAVLTARAILSAREHVRTPLLVHAVLATVIVAGGFGAGVYTGELARYGVTALAALGGALLLAGSWLAVWQARQGAARAFIPAALGWAGVYLALALMMPRVSEDLSSHALAEVAGAQAAAAGGALVVAYHCYPQTFPWELRRPIVVADYVDELGSDGVRPDSLFWSRSEFWRRWNAGERMIVVTKRRTMRDFQSTSIAPTMLASNRTYVLVTNTSPAGTRPLATP